MKPKKMKQKTADFYLPFISKFDYNDFMNCFNFQVDRVLYVYFYNKL
jgi:hypothetical protein